MLYGSDNLLRYGGMFGDDVLFSTVQHEKCLESNENRVQGSVNGFNVPKSLSGFIFEAQNIPGNSKVQKCF